MLRRNAVFILAVAAGSSACAVPRAARAADPQRDSLVIESRVLHERRLINVQTPREYVDRARRFWVLYMPDGGMNEDFPHVTRAVDSLTKAGLIPPTIVVGIPNTERRRDLTGPTRVKSDSAIAPRIGGSAAFRAFIRDELIPMIDARYRTTGERAIIGESLAGLFIVETLLREPSLFQRYAAFDPSLWWNRGAILDSVPSMLPSSRATRAFIAVSRDGIDSLSTRFAGELDRAAPAALRWRFEPHPELTHANIFSALEASALVFALRPADGNR